MVSFGNLQSNDNILFEYKDIKNKKEQITEEIHHLRNEIVGAEKGQITLKIASSKDVLADVQNWFDNSFENIEFLEPTELVSYDDEINC